MAEQTLLEMAKDVARRLNLEVPSAVVTATTSMTVMQLLALFNEEVEEHCNREFAFPKLKVDATFNWTTDANHTALDLSSVAGLRAVIPDTLWDRTTLTRVIGPVSDAQWQEVLTFSTTPTLAVYRVTGNNLLIYPNNSVQHTYGYSYLSRYGVQATGGGARKESFTVDTDVPMLPSRIVKSGVRWRWKALKGQPYAEEKSQYELYLAEEAHQESIPTKVRMDGCVRDAVPGIFISPGSWPLP